jgi:hypothetical protein
MTIRCIPDEGVKFQSPKRPFMLQREDDVPKCNKFTCLAAYETCADDPVTVLCYAMLPQVVA